MTRRYQIVYFLPDPPSGARVPIAALVDDRQSALVAEPAWVPGPRCLGGTAEAATVRMAQSLLRSHRRYGVLPASAGPQVLLGDEHLVPAGVDDPVAWVVEHVLPRRDVAAESLPEEVQTHHRATEGYRFWETNEVAPLVKTRFRPSRVRHGAVPSVSHYVQGNEKVLLLEPLIGTRARFEEDADHVNHVFLAMHGARQKHEPEQEWRLIAFLMAGTDPSQVRYLRDTVQGADELLVVDEPKDRRALLQLVREVGLSGDTGGRVH